MNPFFSVLISCAAILTASCQPSQNSGLKIIGGHPTSEHRPWFVQLLSDASSPEGICGGTLIAPQIVVTAAHCIEPLNVLTLHVALGMADGENLHLNHPVKVRGIIVHPDYSAATEKNDIALLYLEDYSSTQFEMPASPLPISRMINLPESNGSSVKAVGLGKTSSFGNLRDTAVREVDLALIDKAICTEKLESLDSSTQFCAGQLEFGGLDTCQGDSGGPIVVQTPSGELTLVGLTSHGVSCAQKGNPGVYTRVAAFAEWIDRSIEQLVLPRADQATPETLALLLKSHCFSQLGYIPIEVRDGDVNRRETVYSLNLRPVRLDFATEIPTGEELTSCAFEDHGKFIHAKLIRSPTLPGDSSVSVSIVATIDSQAFASRLQPLVYQQDTLWCSTDLGMVSLVDQRNFTKVIIDNTTYSLGLPTADPLPNHPLSGCAIRDASIEVFKEMQSDNTTNLAVRIHHRSLGTITVKLVKDAQEKETVTASVKWIDSTRGTLKFDNRSTEDIFTWQLTCSAPFSLELANGHTLASLPVRDSHWSGVYVDSAIYSEGVINAGSARELILHSLANQTTPAKHCKINDSIWIDATPQIN